MTLRAASRASIEMSRPFTVTGSYSFASSMLIGPATAVAAPSVAPSPVNTSSIDRSLCPLIRARLLIENVAAPNCRS